MKTVKIHQNFGRLRVGKLSNIGRVVLPPQEELKKLTEKADVFIKTCEKEFLYKSNPNRTMGTEALKISARPLKLGFWDKLFNKKTVTEYYPIGNMNMESYSLKNNYYYYSSFGFMKYIIHLNNKIKIIIKIIKLSYYI